MKLTRYLLVIAVISSFAAFAFAEQHKVPDLSSFLPPGAEVPASFLKPTPLGTEMVPNCPIRLSWSNVVSSTPVRFDVYFGHQNPPPRVSQNQEDCEYVVQNPLSPGRYWWRVMLRCGSGDEFPGPMCWFDIPHWIQASCQGTEVTWTIQRPGIFASMISHICVRSNAELAIDLDPSGDLVSGSDDVIKTSYAFGDSLEEADQGGWKPSKALGKCLFPIWPILGHGCWETRHLNLWQKLEVVKCSPAGEYSNVVLVTFSGTP